MKILKMIYKIITEPINFVSNKTSIESVVRFTKKYPIVIVILSAIITGVIAYFLYWS